MIGDAHRNTATGLRNADWEGATGRPVSQETSPDHKPIALEERDGSLMHHRPRIIAAFVGAAGVLALCVAAAGASAGGPRVTVRIEGSARTLLPATTVHVPGSGFITRDGAPPSTCPADSAAGALNAATKGRWAGSFSSSFNDYLVTKILGRTESGKSAFWEVLVNNVAAQTGICETKLRPGDQLVFAAVSLKSKGFALTTKAPASARAGKPFAVKVVFHNSKGVTHPLRGATVTGGRMKATTNAKGVAKLTEARTGTITLKAVKTGYVRAAPVTIKIRGARAATAARSPTAYLLAAQNRDGGFGSAPGQPSSTLYSGWAALGLAAEGHNPGAVRQGGQTLLRYIERHLETDAGSLERTILVARAAGVSPTDFGGRDLVSALRRQIKADGSVRHRVNLTTFAVLALRAAGVTVPARMIRWLVRQQNRNGGFSYARVGSQADVDDTGAALEAIAATARGASSRAVHYIRAAQNRDGGFPSEPGGSSNAQSTAWAVQGLIAAGVKVSKVRHRNSPSPRQYLRSLIVRSGAVNYARRVSVTPVWVTAEAVMALAGKPLPVVATGELH